MIKISSYCTLHPSEQSGPAFFMNCYQRYLARATIGSKRSVNASSDTNDKNSQVSLKALEMLSRGSLSEKSALAVIGTHQDTYSVVPDVRLKALELVEEGKLSERGLIAVLNV